MPDYRVSEDGRRIDVYNAMLKLRNPTFDSDKCPAAQCAKLVAPEVPAVEPGGDPWEAADFIDRQRYAGPQVGGATADQRAAPPVLSALRRRADLLRGRLRDRRVRDAGGRQPRRLLLFFRLSRMPHPEHGSGQHVMRHRGRAIWAA